MKVTIITATYNSVANIKTCIDSVINQDYKDIEYLFIDGKSSDDTITIVKQYQQNYSYIKVISESDNGIYDALNKGIQIASGDIIGFVHSDDVLVSNTIVTEISQKIIDDKLDGAYGDVLHVLNNDLNIITRYWKSSHFNSKLLKRGWMPPHPSLFLKKSVYNKHGLFNLKYKIAGDYDFMLRIFKDEKLNFGYLPIVTHKMRQGGASNGSIMKIYLKSKEDLRAIISNGIGGYRTLILKNILKFKQYIIKT